MKVKQKVPIVLILFLGSVEDQVSGKVRRCDVICVTFRRDPSKVEPNSLIPYAP